jgi:putative FmdB family regulatory protein
MPLYQYRCSSCGFDFEKTLHIKDRDIPTEWPCLKCRNVTVKRELCPSLFKINGYSESNGYSGGK